LTYGFLSVVNPVLPIVKAPVLIAQSPFNAFNSVVPVKGALVGVSVVPSVVASAGLPVVSPVSTPVSNTLQASGTAGVKNTATGKIPSDTGIDWSLFDQVFPQAGNSPRVVEAELTKVQKRWNQSISTAAVVSRMYNYALLGGSFAFRHGWVPGMILGLGLDTVIGELDNPKIAKTPKQRRVDEAKAALLLGTATVSKNLWLQFWKLTKPEHWISRWLVFQDMLTSARRRGQIMSGLTFGLTRGWGAFSKKGGLIEADRFRSVYRQLRALKGMVTEPSNQRKRLSNKSVLISDRTLLNGFVDSIPLPVGGVYAVKRMYNPLVWIMDILRGTPITEWLYPNVMLKRLEKPFAWQWLHAMPGIGLDMIQAALFFGVMHQLLRAGTPATAKTAPALNNTGSKNTVPKLTAPNNTGSNSINSSR
jgi:hypothetical protein